MVRGDVLIGADGLRSVVRAQLFSDGPPRYAGYSAWRAVARIATRESSLARAGAAVDGSELSEWATAASTGTAQRTRLKVDVIQWGKRSRISRNCFAGGTIRLRL